MNNDPLPPPPTIIANKIHPVSSSPLDIYNLKPGSKYFYKYYLDDGINFETYEGIYSHKILATNKIPFTHYIFNKVIQLTPIIHVVGNNVHYAEDYPTDFIEIVTSTTPVKHVSPPPPKGGGKIRKTNRRRRRIGTRKH